MQAANLELLNEFNVLYNSITSNQAPGLDDYEISVFLTKAQNELVRDYFDPRKNKVQEGFDGSEKRQIDFSMIMSSVTYSKDALKESIFDKRKESRSVEIADDVMMLVNEYVIVNRDNKEERLVVIPITYTQYSMFMSKPYKRPIKNQAWRLLDNSNNKKAADLIVGPFDEIKEYVIRYVRRPRAIILRDFTGEDVSFDGGIQTEQTCELDKSLLPELVQRAVELAKAAYLGDLNSQIALGQSSQTDIGVVAQSREK